MSATRKLTRFQTTMGDSWWWRRYADLVDRRESGRAFDMKEAANYVTRWQRQRGPGRKEPFTYSGNGMQQPMLPRPEGMSRQMQRRLYRVACKVEGVLPETKGPGIPGQPLSTKKGFRRAMKELAFYDNQTLSRSERNHRLLFEKQRQAVFKLARQVVAEHRQEE